MRSGSAQPLPGLHQSRVAKRVFIIVAALRPFLAGARRHPRQQARDHRGGPVCGDGRGQGRPTHPCRGEAARENSHPGAGQWAGRRALSRHGRPALPARQAGAPPK
eukprot:422994-Prorocentrum_minimum.AAC.1